MSDKEFDNIVNTIIKAYVTVYGAEKWQSLTEKEQHDVIMTLAKDFKTALERI